MKHSILAFLLILFIVAIPARVISFKGYNGSDDGRYAELAWGMANGEYTTMEYSGPPVFPLRVGLIFPTALGFKIAGPNELVMLIYPFVLSLLSVVLVFIAGWSFFNIRAGLVAASIQAILPIDTKAATMLLPDLPAAFWATLGVLFIHWGSRHSSTRLKSTYGSLSGLFFGLSWLCKESIAYLALFFVIAMIWLTYKEKRNYVLFIFSGLTAIGVLLAESLIYWRFTEDFFYRFHELERNYEVTKTWFFYKGSIMGWITGSYWLALVKRLLKGPLIIFANTNFGLVTLSALVACGYAAFRRMKQFAFLGLWFISLVLMFNFASSSLTSYRPLPLFDRYMYMLLFPAVLLTAGLIDALISSRQGFRGELESEKFFWGSTVAIGIAVVCLLGFLSNFRSGAGPASPVERVVGNILRPTDTVYTDSRTARVLEFFWGYPKKPHTVDFEGMETKDISTGSFVLINRRKVDFLGFAYGYKAPKFYREAPSHWRLKWKESKAELYEIPFDKVSAIPISK